MRGDDGNFSSYKLIQFLKQEKIKEAKQYIDSCLTSANHSYFPINNFEISIELKAEIDKTILPLEIHINRKIYFVVSILGFVAAFIINRFSTDKYENDYIIGLLLIIIITISSIYLFAKSVIKPNPKIIINDNSIIVRKFINPIEYCWSDIFHCSYHYYYVGKSGITQIEVFLYLKNGKIFCFDIKQLDVPHELILAMIKSKLTQHNRVDSRKQ